jgi:transcription factor MYB, plant
MITNNPLSKDNYAPRTACSSTGDVTHQLLSRRSPFAAENSSSSSYASSVDNISKLLDGFMKSTSPQNDTKPLVSEANPLLSFEHMPAGDELPAFADMQPPQPVVMEQPMQQQQAQQAPMLSIEKWLLDEAAEQVGDLMDLSDGCCSVPMLF